LETRVPDLTLWAAPNPSLGLQCLGTARGTAVATGVTSVSLFVLLILAIVRRLRGGPSRFERALARRSRERHAFREVVRAARHEKSLETLTKLYSWLTVRFPGELDRTLTPLRDATPEAGEACRGLERALFHEEQRDRPAGSLVSILRRARKAMGRARRSRA